PRCYLFLGVAFAENVILVPHTPTGNSHQIETIMIGPHSASVRHLGSRGYDLPVGERKFGESSVDFLLGARIDSEWIVRKTRTKFNLEVIQNLKKAIYGIGQGARRWFSGGEISERQASMILDYAVLVELLLEYRDDLQEFRD